MGCDIHIVLEKKDDGKWVGVDSFRPAYDPRGEWRYPVAAIRNYNRFAALAGVRGEGPDPKGFPEDASDLSYMSFHDWGSDAHSASWLELKAATDIFLATGYPLENAAHEQYRKKYPADFYFGVDNYEMGDCRIVFWFDN